jgi:hypothetical protein
MKKWLKLVLVFAILLNSCASGYKNKSWNDKLRVKSIESNILLEYKYDLLKKKYKKERN